MDSPYAADPIAEDFDTGDLFLRSVEVSTPCPSRKYPDRKDTTPAYLFKVHRDRLARASACFNDMLELGENSANDNTSSRDGVPVVQLAESYDVLHLFLCFTCKETADQPSMPELSTIGNVYSACGSVVSSIK